MTHPASTFLGTFTGQNYRAPEPAVTMAQAILAALALALFCGGRAALNGGAPMLTSQAEAELRAIAVYLRGAATMYRKSGVIDVDMAARIFDISAMNLERAIAKLPVIAWQ